jgi:nitrite reductase/ring-hydroxylating ferredoxin subunit
MSEERLLCRLEDLADGASRGFLRRGNDDQVFAVRQGDKVFVWLNDCPHEHRPLEYRQDKFLSGDGGNIVCYAHSAHFDIQSGHCFAGPCTGQALVPVPVRIDGAGVFVPAVLPTLFD